MEDGDRQWNRHGGERRGYSHKIDIVEDCKDITKNKNSNKIEDIALDDESIVQLKNDKIQEILNVDIISEDRQLWYMILNF